MSVELPGGKRFAFTIIDDTDVATTENVRPIYQLLEELGMRTTKTVWSEACPEGSDLFSGSETLEDPGYRAFVVDLQRRGFEIAWHGATMESSDRERTLDGLDRFRDTFGADPRVYANHAYNRENLYWGEARIDDPILRGVYRRFNGRPPGYYQGHVEGSRYFWGDVCHDRIEYVRNLTFRTVNLLEVNPSIPYHDPTRPHVRWWFSAADADDCHAFNELLSRDALDGLADRGGVCIVATHLGKGYVRNGEVHPRTRAVLERLARRDGWFPPVGELLDFLRAQRSSSTLPRREWARLQWRWAFDLAARKWERSKKRRKRRGRG